MSGSAPFMRAIPPSWWMDVGPIAAHVCPAPRALAHLDVSLPWARLIATESAFATRAAPDGRRARQLSVRVVVHGRACDCSEHLLESGEAGTVLGPICRPFARKDKREGAPSRQPRRSVHRPCASTAPGYSLSKLPSSDIRFTTSNRSPSAPPSCAGIMSKPETRMPPAAAAGAICGSEMVEPQVDVLC